MKKTGNRVFKPHIPCSWNYKIELLRWLMLFVVMLVMSFLADGTGKYFLIAPPLIVTFAEFSFEDSPARKSPFLIFVVISLCAWTGSLCRYFITVRAGLILTLSATVAIIAVLIICNFTKKFFPPAGAIALLPMIIDPSQLLMYPLFVMIGTAIFITFAMLIGNVVQSVKLNFVREEIA